MAPRSSYFLTYPLFLLFLLLVLLVVLVGDTARKNRMLFDPLAPLTLAEEEVRPEPIQARSSLEFPPGDLRRSQPAHSPTDARRDRCPPV